MLAALKGIPQPDVPMILADASASLLPDTEGQDLRSSDSSEKLRTAILGEVRRRLFLSADDQSPRARGKIFDLLSQEITRSILPPDKEKSVRARLGNRGALRLDLYRIRFGSRFYVSDGLGVKRSHAENTLRHADAVEHLGPPPSGWGNAPPLVSLFAKRVQPESGDEFVLLVHATRVGDELVAEYGWRVYQNDVDLSGTLKPSDILSRFLAVYGIPFLPNDESPRLLYSYEKVPDPPGLWGRLDIPAGAIGQYTFTTRPSPGTIEIALAYVVNVVRYADDLRLHGVRAEIIDTPQLIGDKTLKLENNVTIYRTSP